MKQLEPGVVRDDSHGAVCQRVTCQVELLYFVQIVVVIERRKTTETILGHVQHSQSEMPVHMNKHVINTHPYLWKYCVYNYQAALVINVLVRCVYAFYTEPEKFMKI